MYLLLKSAFLNLFRRKSRTILSILAICIGIVSLIVMISVVDGVYQDSLDILGKMQGIFVYEKGKVDPVFSNIDDSYINKIKTIPGIKEVAPEIYAVIAKLDNEIIEFNPTAAMTLVGLNADKIEYSSYGALIEKVTKGQIIKGNDNDQVIISKQIAEDYSKFVGENIEINNKKFKIKGIFETSSDFTKYTIIGRTNDVREVVDLKIGEYNGLYITPINLAESDKIASKIEFRFEDLQAQSQQDMTEQIGDLLDQLKLLVIFVASIAAVVAGVGVINTMLMSVMERTKEIGTLKAIGWTSQNVIIMILVEALLIGIMGGVLGVTIGIWGSNALGTTFGLNTFVSTTVIISSFLFAVIIGIIGGLYPAYVASRLDPIEALRDA
jgi:putative ABC transport system permease protein